MSMCTMSASAVASDAATRANTPLPLVLNVNARSAVPQEIEFEGFLARLSAKVKALALAPAKAA